jgi:hypothetical protein
MNNPRVKRAPYNDIHRLLDNQLNNLQELIPGTNYIIGVTEENMGTNPLNHLADNDMSNLNNRRLHFVKYIGFDERNYQYVFKNLNTNGEERYDDMELIDIRNENKPTIYEIKPEINDEYISKIISSFLGGNLKRKSMKKSMKQKYKKSMKNKYKKSMKQKCKKSMKK